jgi:hypothetical protein
MSARRSPLRGVSLKPDTIQQVIYRNYVNYAVAVALAPLNARNKRLNTNSFDTRAPRVIFSLQAKCEPFSSIAFWAG